MSTRAADAKVELAPRPWWDPDTGSTVLNALIYSLRGAGKGFAVYFIPFAILRRRISEQLPRRSLSVALFVATVRLADRLLGQLLPKSPKASKLTAPPTAHATADTVGAAAPTAVPTDSGSGPASRSSSADVAVTKMQEHPIRTLLRTPPSQWSAALFKSLLRKYRHGIGGALAAVVALSVDHSIHNGLFVLWTLVRAVRAIYPAKWEFPALPVLVLCLASSQILSSWIVACDELDPAYLKFLDHHGGQSPATMKRLRMLPTTICADLHPGLSCETHIFVYFLHGFRRALKVYVPLSLVMLAISTRKSLRDFVINVVRSTTFLAMYCMLAFCTGCYMYRVSPQITRFKLYVHTFSAGLAALVERPSRRVELAGYVATYALDTIYRILRKRKLVVPNAFVGWSTLVLASGVLIYNYDQQPHMFTRWLLGIDRPILGRPTLVPLLHAMAGK